MKNSIGSRRSGRAVKPIFLLLLLSIPIGSQAQSLKLPTVVFASTAAADWASTYVGVTRYHLREQNRMINHINNPALMVTAGAAIDVAGVAAWNRFIGRSHPRVAAVGLYVGSAARLYLTGRNISGSRRPSFWHGGTAGIR